MTQRQNSKPVVYILDDEAGIRMMLTHVLAAWNYQVAQFATAASLIAAIQQCRPEVLVLDLSLAQTDAIEVIRQLEIIRFTGQVLLISGSDPTTLKHVKEIGIRHNLAMLPVLRKPFRPADLKAALESIAISAQPQSGSAQQKLITLDVQEALEQQWLELWYQPKIELKSMLVCGAEALARVNHPTHGVLSPVAFIPPANDPRHEPLSRFVIRQALHDWSQFAASGLLLKLAINMPVSVIQSGEFLHYLRELLPPDDRFPGLTVEMTEDEIIRDVELIRETATQLKLYGVSISVDDFGTAHSSLSRLFDCPCAELKIDRKFVHGCGSDKLKRSLCQTVVDLGHRIGAQVCAEGIESIEDLRCLNDLGCELGQGFLFARPMPASRLQGFVRRMDVKVEIGGATASTSAVA